MADEGAEPGAEISVRGAAVGASGAPDPDGRHPRRRDQFRRDIGAKIADDLAAGSGLPVFRIPVPILNDIMKGFE